METASPIGPKETSLDQLVEITAEMAHEANRVWQRLCDAGVSPVWASAPDWQKVSARKGVRLHFASHHGLGPETSHNAWMSEKLRAGWTYGVKKDPAAKTHPCLLPYGELPTEQKAKDAIFGGICGAIRSSYPKISSALLAAKK